MGCSGGSTATLFSENMAVNRAKVIRVLSQGKEFADRLQVLLQRPFGGDGSSAEELVLKILRSFTETLFVLGGGNCETTSSAGEVCCDDDSTVSGGRRSEDSGESKKRLPGPKGRRGCYKRKKNSETWRIVTSTIEDGHAWRKYGQKDILNTLHPRSYFRCTHKYEQGCKATKQVQKMKDNPQMYEIIYIGNHTCRKQMSFTEAAAAAPPPPQMIITNNVYDGPWSWSSSVLSSSSTLSTGVGVVKKEYNFKEEAREIGGGDDLSENLSSSHHHDHAYHHHEEEQQHLDYSAMWEDLLPLDGDVAVSAVYSCTDHDDHHNHQLQTTTTNTSPGFHIDFDSELCFDESDFFLPGSS